MAVSSNSVLSMVLITAALVLSGCAGKSDVKGGDGGVPPVAPSGQLSEDTCAIEGLVTDEEFNPLPGAQVGILDLGDKKTTSAADGGFSFSFLEPGSYQLAATKPGYDPDVKRVTCEAGAKATTQLSLIRIPDPLVSYARIYPVEKGHIGCSVGFLSFSTDDFCKTTGINPNGRNKMTYKPDPYQVTSMIMGSRLGPERHLRRAVPLRHHPRLEGKEPRGHPWRRRQHPPERGQGHASDSADCPVDPRGSPLPLRVRVGDDGIPNPRRR
jgi:hypothetical protein